MKKILKGFIITAVAIVLLAFGYVFLFAIKDGKAIIGSTKTVSGNVVGIYDGGVYDIVFKLDGDNHTYYVNRGLQNGLTIEGLRDSYLHKELSISYVSQMGRVGGHINRIVYADSMVYNELK